MMVCYVCDANNWGSQGALHTKSEILVCQTCGNVAHRVEPDADRAAKMRDYYRHSYRGRIGFANLLTTTNKLNYVNGFLRELLAARAPNKNGGKRMACVDIGCATGYIPAALRRRGHRATGCELTLTMRRFTEAYYGIPITEDLVTKRQYDLLSAYHVLEHLPEPDKRLAEWAAAMAPEGRMLISTPEWFDSLEENSGADMVDFEHLFHKDHINVFSARSLQNLFAKAGLVIEKEDHFTYGQTYLLRRWDGVEPRPAVIFEDPKERSADLSKAKKAIDLYMRGDYNAAKGVWRKFPEAWLKLIMEVQGKDPESQALMWDEIRPFLGDNARCSRTMAIWLYRNDRHEAAIKVLEDLAERKPTADVFVWLGWCYAEVGRPVDAMKAMERAAVIDPTKWAECMDWVCNLASKMPTWDERAVEEFKNEAARRATGAPELTDNVMDEVAA